MSDYTLSYWPIPFRGHILRFLMAEAGARWEETGYEATAAIRATAPNDQSYPAFAPPVLDDHATGRQLCQMPAIAMYLAGRHGLLHNPEETLRLLCDASDILFEITRYHGALMWDAKSWSAFTAERLPRWMAVHEQMVPEDRFLFGATSPSAADLVLAALWHTMINQLPPLREMLNTHAPRLEAHVDRIASRPRIAKLVQDWADCDPVYCGGQIEASLLAVLGLGR